MFTIIKQNRNGKFIMNVDFLDENSSFFSELSNRELEFFWVYFRLGSVTDIPYQSNINNLTLLPPLEKIKTDLIDHFNKNRDFKPLVELIKLLKINRIVEPKYTHWINQKNQRQINFILSKINEKTFELMKNNSFDTSIKVPNHKEYKNAYKITLPPNTPNFNNQLRNIESIEFIPYNYQISINISLPLPKKISNNEYEILLYNLDLLNIKIVDKLSLLEGIREQWDFFIKKREQYYSWIVSSNEEQITWILDYLEKKGKYFKYSILFNEENFTPYNKLLTLLDNIDTSFYLGTEIDIFKFFEKMKKSWSQQNYRNSGKIKKPYHLPLTKTAQIQLEKLAELKNTKKENIIEELIAQEYSKYTDSNGKFKY